MTSTDHETHYDPCAPLVSRHTHLATMLERVVSGLECGAPREDREVALGILGEPDPVCHVCEERLFCAAWNCLHELGLPPHRIDPALECEGEEEAIGCAE